MNSQHNIIQYKSTGYKKSLPSDLYFYSEPAQDNHTKNYAILLTRNEWYFGHSYAY